MRTYTIAKHRPVHAETADEAADVFARRIFGRRGAVGALRQDSVACDGSYAIYTVFIEYGPDRRRPRGPGNEGVTGHNYQMISERRQGNDRVPFLF